MVTENEKDHLTVVYFQEEEIGGKGATRKSFDGGKALCNQKENIIITLVEGVTVEA